MPSRLKELMLEETDGRYRGAHSMVFVGYRGLSAQEMSDLRAELRKQRVRLRVVRNRVVLQAFSRQGRPAAEVAGLLDGPTAVMDGEDAVAMARAALACAKKGGKLQVQGALVEGQVLGPRDVSVLSTMPGRIEMLGILAGLAGAPGARLAAALAAPGGGVAGAIQAFAEKGNEQPESPAGDAQAPAEG